MPDGGGDAAAPAGPVLLSKSEFARHRGVTPAQVTHWIKASPPRVVLVGGRVDRDASDALLESTLDRTRGGKGGLTAAAVALNTPPAGSSGAAGAAPAGSSGVAPPPAAGTHLAASIAEKEVGVEIKRIRLRQLGDELVDRAAYMRESQGIAAALRERLAAIGPALGSRLAAETDARRCRAMIDAEVAGALRDMVEALNRQDADPGAT